MAKIITIVGKSASGKNHIYEALLKKYPKLVPVVSHTTRPIRLGAGEVDGKDYFFINSKKFIEKIASGEMFEYREYDTAHGRWYYGTSLNQIDIKSNNTYIAIVDLKGLKAYINQFGADNIVSYYITAKTGIRLFRMIKRESGIDESQKNEIIRRYFADEEAFKDVEKWTNCTISNNTEDDLNTAMDIIGLAIEKSGDVNGI